VFTRVTNGSSVGSWSGGVQEDTALSVSILVEDDSEVALLTPGGTPRVSHEEVIFASLATVANSGDSMILLGATSLVINDTLLVEHESVAIGIDTNAGWLLVDGGLQLFYLLRFNLSEALNTDLTHIFSSLAFTIFALVWIVRLERDLVLFSILESPDFETTVATIIFLFGIIAVNEMLL